MTGAPRYVVQRSYDGHVWITRGSRSDAGAACTLADQLANRGGPGEMFRVVDADDGGSVVFTVENP